MRVNGRRGEGRRTRRERARSRVTAPATSGEVLGRLISPSPCPFWQRSVERNFVSTSSEYSEAWRRLWDASQKGRPGDARRRRAGRPSGEGRGPVLGARERPRAREREGGPACRGARPRRGEAKSSRKVLTRNKARGDGSDRVDAPQGQKRVRDRASQRRAQVSTRVVYRPRSKTRIPGVHRASLHRQPRDVKKQQISPLTYPPSSPPRPQRRDGGPGAEGETTELAINAE